MNNNEWFVQLCKSLPNDASLGETIRNISVNMNTPYIKPNVYKILSDCVDNGIEAGYNKFLKRNDIELTPAQEQSLKFEMSNYIMLIISENFDFND